MAFSMRVTRNRWLSGQALRRATADEGARSLLGKKIRAPAAQRAALRPIASASQYATSPSGHRPCFKRSMSVTATFAAAARSQGVLMVERKAKRSRSLVRCCCGMWPQVDLDVFVGSRSGCSYAGQRTGRSVIDLSLSIALSVCEPAARDHFHERLECLRRPVVACHSW